jgi:hypothetical protein
MRQKNIRTYTELSKLKTFKQRFEYLKLDGKIGEETFGYDRYINQRFYKDPEYRAIRDYVIVRDNGCDMGVEGYEYVEGEKIIIHHMNPITVEDIVNRSEFALDPEYMVSVRHLTHNAIHYGDESLLIQEPIERRKNDTCPWRRD